MMTILTTCIVACGILVFYTNTPFGFLLCSTF